MSTSQNRRINKPYVYVTTRSGKIEPIPSAKLLGAVVSEDLLWSEHLVESDSSLLKTLSLRSNALKSISYYADFRTRLMIANGIFLSKLCYLIPLWSGTTDQTKRMLQTAQNKAARYMLKCSWDTPTRELLSKCNWLSINQLAAFHSIVTIHKILHCKEPKYLSDKFQGTFPRNTRLASSGAIRIDCRFKASLSLTESSFRWKAAKLYNRLPEDIRTEKRLPSFKANLKTWIKDNIDI